MILSYNIDEENDNSSISRISSVSSVKSISQFLFRSRKPNA
jgi:hypothetical protein